MNGLNGGNVPAMVTGYPTPAGYQAELAYIYNMVEVLSQQLAENKRALEDVVASVGRVRSRARTQSLGNEELISSAADELGSQEANMDSTISLLTELFERAKFSRDEYRNLSAQYASVIAAMLKQFHDYKQKHVADVGAWHRSYRAQLAEERAENTRLREQIWEMQAHAGKANENLRQFRTKYDEDKARWEKRVDTKAMRQELRFWKRMAMPEMSDDDPYWSDDDDLVDQMEKLRLQELERKAAEEALAGVGSMDQSMEGLGHDPTQSMQFQMGGVPMQREDSGGLAIPALPFYWYEDRQPATTNNEPFFDCFQCLDEVNEEYADNVACTECTGLENQVYSSQDLVNSSAGALGKNKNLAAYNRVIENYHSYLVVLLSIFLVNDCYHAIAAENAMQAVKDDPNVSLNEAYKASLLEKFKNGNYFDTCADKFLAEQKCRQDVMHSVPDTVGLWEKNETHVSEHRPWINNMSTSIKRQLIEMASQTFVDPEGLEVGFWPVEFDDEAAFQRQPHIEGVQAWWRRRRIIESDTLKAPLKPGGLLPWDLVEYVPLFANEDLEIRLEWLNENLEFWLSTIEADVPRGSMGIPEGSEPDRVKRNERFCRKTLDLIHELLAFDPGLSTSRMRELAPWFMSIVIQPYMTHPLYRYMNLRPPVPDNAPYTKNANLRRTLIFLDDCHVDLKWYPKVDEYWSSLAYGCGQNSVMLQSNAFMIKNPRAQDVQARAVMRWMDFYKSFQHVLAEVGDSYTRVTQDEIDRQAQEGSLSDFCNVCGNAWADLKDPHNFAVSFRPCGLRHAMCLGCFKQVSLQPASLNGRRCPICKQGIQYPPQKNILSAELGQDMMLPSLANVFM